MDGTHLQYTSGAKQVCYDLQVKIRDSLVDIKVLSVRILLKEALVLTNRYFVFVFVFLGYRHYLFDIILESIPIGS